MTTPKAPFFAFAVSLVFHAAAVASFGVPWGRNGGGMAGDAIEIDYVLTSAVKKPSAPIARSAPAVPSKKTSRSEALAKPGSQSAQGDLAAKPVRRKGIKPWYPPETPVPKGSADFLTDPGKAKVFLNYFGLVKRRIDATVRKRYFEEALVGGTVSLAFVLNSDGVLESVSVIDAQTSASADVRQFAVRCLRETAPFIAFPAELGVKQIAFNVTVLFDEF